MLKMNYTAVLEQDFSHFELIKSWSVGRERISGNKIDFNKGSEMHYYYVT